MNQETVSKKKLQMTAELYGLNIDCLEFVGGIENSVYRYEKNGQSFFLRFGDISHMSFNLVSAEIDWVLYLLNRNIPAVKPVASDNGLFVERINTGSNSYNVVAFEEAEGDQLDFGNPKSWNDSVVRDWGKTIGRMHSVTKEYKPKSSRRYEFKPEVDLPLIKRESKKIINSISDLLQRMHELPKGREVYGLVHSDIHVGNFFVKNDKISAILDFDRACYKWFISEVAIALYYPLYITSLRENSVEQRKFASEFLPVFREGYETEHRLNESWTEHLDMFIRVRDAILFMYLPSDVPEALRERFRRRIVGEDPYTEIHWDAL
jgi:Ser/Thr protein kinase RdoA (MazF antagonist)